MFESRQNWLREKHVEVYELFRRLDGITGFVSVLGDDPRVRTFRRSDHVERVATVVAWLGQDLTADEYKRAMLAVYLHDLNRLPFAHNLERPMGYRQVDDFAAFLARAGVRCPVDLVDEILVLLQKRAADCSRAMRVVLYADLVAGCLEDVLFAVGLFGLPLAAIPPAAAAALHLSDDASTRAELQALRRRFDAAEADFAHWFTRIVFRRSQTVLMSLGGTECLPSDPAAYAAVRALLRGQLLEPLVFPLNNEAVAGGTRLWREIGEPVITAIRSDGFDPVRALLALTDRGMLALALERKIITDPLPYCPRLPTPIRE